MLKLQLCTYIPLELHVSKKVILNFFMLKFSDIDNMKDFITV